MMGLIVAVITFFYLFGVVFAIGVCTGLWLVERGREQGISYTQNLEEAPMRLALPYRSPIGLPLRWQDDQSSQMPQAIMAFINSQIEKTELADPQLALVRAWCEYYIEAPCWQMAAVDYPEGQEDLKQRREEIRDIKTAEELNEWLHKCLELPIDPL